ncbi:MAG: DUF6326 family protein [Pseudoalteromonas spongiae]|uniref:DUF6326 family protein n=1 Tax=Pseudoalteromonas spongiae TaxID=298657 RepID=UPI00110BEA07|nr:DUF6326 family protein [Pseudoalteromonas spongiae]MEC8327174.1 DUF6326 family protein [Pseudomonadota bacterium]TMO88525.1 hypothetical protein CWC15_00745 [Pseudoalteromonas spongiae]
MSKTNQMPSGLVNDTINVKLKLAALWAAVMFCYVYGDYIEVYVPGVMSNAMAVSANSEGLQAKFFAVAFLMSIPSLMVFLSLVLKPTVNRWLNIIIPALFVLLLIGLNLETTWIFYLYLTALEIILSLATIWFAWRWPKNDAS